ncbi:MAG: hypothetical protein QXW70_01385 [Candidatus Anstonellales archaeon]
MEKVDCELVPYKRHVGLVAKKNQTKQVRVNGIFIESREKEIEIVNAYPYSKFFFVKPLRSSFFMDGKAVTLNSVDGRFFLGRFIGKDVESFEKKKIFGAVIYFEEMGAYSLHDVSKRILFDRELYKRLRKAGANVYFLDLKSQDPIMRRLKKSFLSTISEAYAKMHLKEIFLGAFYYKDIALNKGENTLYAEFLDTRNCEKTKDNLLPDFIYALAHLYVLNLIDKKEMVGMIKRYLAVPNLFEMALEYVKGFGMDRCSSIEETAHWIVERTMKIRKYVEMISYEKEIKRQALFTYVFE